MDDQSEVFWESVLQAIVQGSLVPVIGREALVLDTPEGPARLDQLLARRLAAAVGVDEAELPEGYDLNDVVVRADGFNGKTSKATATRIFTLVQQLEQTVPETLRLLAEVPGLTLFVSLTFDTLLEKALAEARGRRPAVGAFPANTTDHADLDPALLAQPGGMLFHLLGRRSVTPTDYAVTEGQVLESMHNVMTASNRPSRLIQRLQDSNLLLLGLGLPDWPSRFLVRMARRDALWNDRDTSEIVAQASMDGLPLFLHRFSPDCLTLPATPLEFARELHRRWFERFPATPAKAAALPAAALPAVAEAAAEPALDMAQGTVFVSYAREDREPAFRLADALDEAGVEVWIDRRLEPGDDYEHLIRRHIPRASAFVAVLSSHTLDPQPRWYRREWQLACKHNEKFFLTGQSFVYPVIVDGSTARAHGETLSAFNTQAARAAGGEPEAQLVKALVQVQRAARRARTA